ncbi:MAG: AlpA family phage regulatory protein [Burkholderiales bacterium]|nr:AlpA family phage regulatory protein [Burkholderiales bacterium]
MLLRPPRAIAELGMSRTQFYEAQRLGLITKSVKIGERAAAFPANEIEQIKRARVAGLGELEVKALVSQLHAQREAMAAELRAGLKGGK